MVVHNWKSSIEEFKKTFKALVENDLKVDVLNLFGFLDVTKNVILVNVHDPRLAAAIIKKFGFQF